MIHAWPKELVQYLFWRKIIIVFNSYATESTSLKYSKIRCYSCIAREDKFFRILYILSQVLLGLRTYRSRFQNIDTLLKEAFLSSLLSLSSIFISATLSYQSTSQSSHSTSKVPSDESTQSSQSLATLTTFLVAGSLHSLYSLDSWLLNFSSRALLTTNFTIFLM
jgi:hypothetical protein